MKLQFDRQLLLSQPACDCSCTQRSRLTRVPESSFRKLSPRWLTEDFADGLRDCGLVVSDSPTLMEIAGAMTKAIDASMPNCKRRSDVSEMAQMAAVESITNAIGARLPSLFGTAPQDIQQAFARLGTVTQMGRLARDFFGRFLNKTLSSFLSKTLSQHTGDGRRFRTLAQQAEFSRAMETHCMEASKSVENYSGEWLSKHNWLSGGNIKREDVARFTGHAMTKLTDALQRGGHTDGE